MRPLIVDNTVGFTQKREELIPVIRAAGWDGVFTDWPDDRGIAAYARIAKEEGLIYHSVHAPFNRVDRLWEDGEEGEYELKRQIRCIEDTAAHGVDLVILHTIIGMDKCTPTERGVERYGKIFAAAKRTGIRVALENTEGECYLTCLLNAYPDAHIGFCWDSGHEQCYNGGQDLLKKYGNRLFSTHLNDNFGQTTPTVDWHDDAHVLPYEGIIDWTHAAEKLNQCGFVAPLTFELGVKSKPGRHANDRYESMTPAEFYTEARKAALRFRDEVEKKR